MENGPPRRRNPLGVLAFTYQGTEYFVTRRAPRLAPGIQTRYLDERTIIRITTIEQTLLDTLHKPQRAGGPEVIFEAWRSRASELDEDLLASYLRAMSDAPSVRRTGAMLDLLGYKVTSDALKSVLTKTNPPLDRPISLLAGIDYQRLDPAWSVLTP
jgi:predicted transcriptional regulator of viral defense system